MAAAPSGVATFKRALEKQKRECQDLVAPRDLSQHNAAIPSNPLLTNVIPNLAKWLRLN